MNDYYSKKIVLVLKNNIEPWQAMNVSGHLSVSLGQQAEDLMGRKIHKDASGLVHKGISRFGYVTLAAKSGQLRNLISELRQTNLLFVDYPKEMLDTKTDDDLNEQIIKKEEEKMEYLGVIIYGETDKIDKLTKKFGLYN